MKRVVLSGVLSLFLCLQLGCSISPIQVVLVDNNTLEKKGGISLMDPNDELYSQDVLNSSWGRCSGMSEGIKRGKFCRVKYHPSYSQYRWMVVEGRLGNGKTYPVVLDTGASVALVVNDIHVLENKLPIYPFRDGNNDLTGWGISNLSELQIGEVSLIKWPCFYRGQHTEVQLFGFPLEKDKAIVAGLQMLRKFRYVEFDSVKKEAEFSLEKAFNPVEPELWARYAFVIDEDINGNAFLFVKIPIAGKETELQLDTGSGRGLAIREELWEEIHGDIPDVRLRKGEELYPYIGWLNCQRGIAPELEVGNRIIKNAEISVFPDNSPLVDSCQGLLGMQYFQDSAIVLDFERNLMWVKRCQENQATSVGL